MSSGSWRVPEAAAGERLDRALAEHLALPRNQIQSWIRQGKVTVDDALPGKAGQLLRAGQRVAWEIPEAPEQRILPEGGELRLLHVDADLLVLDKPADLTVHPGAGRREGTLVHRLVAHFPELAEVGGPGRPGIVHRLDRGTSGVLVVARTPTAYRDLVRQFAERRVDKRYLAIVRGAPRVPAGRVEAPIGRHPVQRQRMAVRTDGRMAISGYRTIAAARGLALLEVHLFTGRTHQIRVHLRHLGHPIVGDPTYGDPRAPQLRRTVAARSLLSRPALHAWRIALTHPASGAPCSFEARLAEDLASFWREATGTALPDLTR